jgi:predicted DNA-binding transcriptional regulator AlpA
MSLRFKDLAGLGITYSRTHVHLLTKMGKFPKPTKTLSGHIMWDRDAVHAWIKARTDELGI